MNEIEELRACVNRLRLFAQLLAEELDVDPAGTIVTVTANPKGGDGEGRTLAEVSLADVFADAERLAPSAPATDPAPERFDA